MSLLALLILVAPEIGQTAPPLVSTEVGQPYRLVFSDGREAVFKISHVDSPPSSAKFKVIDNTCAPRQNITCDFEYQLRRFFVSAVWSKHPDDAKIGTFLQRQDRGGAEPLDDTDVPEANLPVGPAGRLHRELIAQMLRCDDFSWLPAGRREAPASVDVIRWDVENNIRNQETGVIEARSTGGALDVRLRRRDQHRLAAVHAAALAGHLRLVNFLMVQPSGSLTLLTPEGQTCQVGVSARVSDLKTAYDALEKFRPPLNSIAPALVGGAELKERPVTQAIKPWLALDESVLQ